MTKTTISKRALKDALKRLGYINHIPIGKVIGIIDQFEDVKIPTAMDIMIYSFQEIAFLDEDGECYSEIGASKRKLIRQGANFVISKLKENG